MYWNLPVSDCNPPPSRAGPIGHGSARPQDRVGGGSCWRIIDGTLQASNNPSLAGRPGYRLRPLGFDPICALVSDKDVARAVQAAGLRWDENSAHSAAYDAEITADLFCDILNRFKPVFETARQQDWPDQTEEIESAS